MTDKLFLYDSYIRDFSAKLVAARETAAGWEVELDRTAFYPEGGGQPCDTGEINGIPVCLVYERDGRVIHLLKGKPAEDTVSARIDWARRFDHMQQHSGQHILSAVLDNMYQAATVGFHLGIESTQIDLPISDFSLRQAEEVEAAVNAAIYNNLPITADFVNREDLSKFPLRKQLAKDFAQLRLISVENLDCCPCGGTHLHSTGEIGAIKILGWEKKNNLIRLDFVCGRRALSDYQQKHLLAKQLSAKLSVPVPELSEALEQRLAKIEALTKELADAKAELNKHLAAKLLHSAKRKSGTRLVSHVLNDSQPNEASALAKALTSAEPAVALIAAVSPGCTKAHLVFAANIDGPDMNKLLRQALQTLNGKGGGTPRLAQGGANNPSGLHELLDSILENITI